ncbi:hypothetical protein [Lactococcus ileimucosae]|uniref:hypothetical protein n=1 Tax=Lactococcus ileimucosae TaxID=2941329 RepID=UPI002043EE71|nr:hypothetical protein [Lactococcus ileimucosae]
MIHKITSEISLLLDKAVDIKLDFRKREYTFDDLLVFLQKNNRSKDLRNLLSAIDSLESTLYLLNNSLNDIADIQQKFRG